MSSFTIRVYGIIIGDRGLLLSREKIQGAEVVKFPGGGLQYGEGTRACLLRELLEETGSEAKIGDHFYTTDFFQPSAFHSAPVQVMSIYYKATLLSPPVSGQEENNELFWVPFEELSSDLVNLPIDKVVVEKLLQLK